MTYGDGLSDVNISDVVKFHKSHGRIATLNGAPFDSDSSRILTPNNRSPAALADFTRPAKGYRSKYPAAPVNWPPFPVLSIPRGPSGLSEGGRAATGCGTDEHPGGTGDGDRVRGDARTEQRPGDRIEHMVDTGPGDPAKDLRHGAPTLAARHEPAYHRTE